MKTELFYYTGTGNSLWTARMLAIAMGDVEIIPISSTSRDSVASGAEAIGIIFPVHIWGQPRRVIAFVEALEKKGDRYYFAVAVNAGQVAATLIQLKKRMQIRGLPLSAGFGLEMPSNYIPRGGPGPKERQIRQIELSREKIGRIAASCAARKKLPVEKGPLWKNIFFAGLNRLSFPRIPTMDRSFWVDEKCNGCGICKSICPSGNIYIQGDRPALMGVSLSACAPKMVTKGDKFPLLYQEAPASILILPPMNESTAAEAKDYYATTIQEPLSFRGYYVFPYEITTELLKIEGIYDSELIKDVPLQKFREYFGADAVLFTTIKKWDLSYMVLAANLTISIDCELKSAKSNVVLWRYNGTVVVNLSGGNTGGGVAGLLVKAVVAAVSSAMADYVPHARTANYMALNTMPFGKYHELYGKDREHQFIEQIQPQPQQYLAIFPQHQLNKIDTHPVKGRLPALDVQAINIKLRFPDSAGMTAGMIA